MEALTMETITNIVILDNIFIALFFIVNVIIYIRHRRTSKIIQRNVDRLASILSEDLDKKIGETIDRYYRNKLEKS